MSLANKTHFFVVAHPDDVELFMFQSLVDALEKKENIVLITLTAGDDGKGYQGGKEDAYWYLRNLGQQRAIKYLIDRIQGNVKDFFEERFGLRCYVANNVYIYSLMLPDQLVEKKSNKTFLFDVDLDPLKKIDSLDKSQSYSRNNIIKLIESIFKKHTSFFGKALLHITGEHLPIEQDHLDHQVVGRWAKEAFEFVNGDVNLIFRYQTYMNYESPITMSNQLMLLHAAIWGIYNNFILQVYPELSGRRQMEYLGKQYLL